MIPEMPGGLDRLVKHMMITNVTGVFEVTKGSIAR